MLFAVALLVLHMVLAFAAAGQLVALVPLGSDWQVPVESLGHRGLRL